MPTSYYTNETWMFDYLSFWFIKQFSNSSEIMCPIKKFINQNNQKCEWIRLVVLNMKILSRRNKVTIWQTIRKGLTLSPCRRPTRFGRTGPVQKHIMLKLSRLGVNILREVKATFSLNSFRC